MVPKAPVVRPLSNTLWYLYVIRTVDNFLYAGVTTDVIRRYKQHETGKGGAKYLRAHKPQMIVLAQAIGTRSQAQKIEYRFKRLSKKEKEKIIRQGKVVIDGENRVSDL